MTPLFSTIKKLALQTNEIKRQSAINQSYHIIHTFDLRQTLPKYFRTFLHKNSFLTIGLTDQSDYSIFHLLVRLFIHTVNANYNESNQRKTTCTFYIYKNKQLLNVFIYKKLDTSQKARQCASCFYIQKPRHFMLRNFS